MSNGKREEFSIMETMTAAIFLDRDGVIIENIPTYVRHWNEVHFYPQALTALARLRSSPYKIIIVSNQSAIGRGLLSREEADEINRRLVATIEHHGGRIDAVYICPHTPQDQCMCRKPQPGLILQAANELGLDLSRSLLIGDALSDLQAGQAAGIQKTILVLTGRGAEQWHLPEAKTLQPFEVYPDLLHAIQAETRLSSPPHEQN